MTALRFNCPHCAQPLEAPTEAAGAMFPCPACGKEIQVTASASPLPAIGTKCGVCLSPIGEPEAKHCCPECQAEYHEECWQENGGCAVYGCSQVPVIEKRAAIEIPMSYWGQEKKKCPKCKNEIMAAAVRCRFCGATFESARPQEADEFYRRKELSGRLPAARRMVVWMFVFCVLPCLAPIGAVWSLIWYPTHREEVRALPAVYPALCKIGLGVAILQTVGVIVFTLLYAFFGH